MPAEPFGPFREVTIKETAYTTYEALLCYLLTSHISFAPLLRSSGGRGVPTDDPNGSDVATTPPHAAYLASQRTQIPLLPLPTSPKSLYRLAHLLELPKLRQLALKAIKERLDVRTVAWEVFGNESGVYDKVRKIEVEFVARHWEEVKGGRAFKEVKERRDKFPYFADVLVDLVAKL